MTAVNVITYRGVVGSPGDLLIRIRGTHAASAGGVLNSLDAQGSPTTLKGVRDPRNPGEVEWTMQAITAASATLVTPTGLVTTHPTSTPPPDYMLVLNANAIDPVTKLPVPVEVVATQNGHVVLATWFDRNGHRQGAPVVTIAGPSLDIYVL